MNNLNKKSLLVMAGAAIFLLGWYRLMHQLGWTPQPPGPGSAPPPSAAPAVPPGDHRPDSDPVQVVDPVADSAPPSPSPAPAQTGDSMRHTPPPSEPPITFGDPEGNVAFLVDPARGGIVGTNLLKFEPYDAKGSGDSVLLGSWQYPFCSLVADGVGPATAGTMVEENGTLTLTRRGDDGLEVQESWRFPPDEADRDESYRFVYEVKLVNTGASSVRLAPAVRLGGLAAEASAGGPKMSRVGAIDLGVDVALDLKRRPNSLNTKKIGKFRPADIAAAAQTPVAWVAVHNKYFAYFLRPVPDDTTAATTITGVSLGADQLAAGQAEGAAELVDWVFASGYLGGVELPPDGGTAVFRFDGYAGPKELARLTELAPNAGAIMRLDFFMFFRATWMEVIAKIILHSLIALNGFFGGAYGFGFAIIVVTFVIKMIFWPLTHRSTISMRRMAKLQPEIKAIREKYKDDPQLANRKTMEFYREQKVSPMGGCLPMLLQIPVFFALFNTLRGAVELRHAAFLYVSDLSMPDTLAFQPFGLPIRPLAILMAGTMLLQQHMTPTSGDPSQKRMMTFMSIFFMFIFYSMPSGLTLYWTTNQVLTIIQNMIGKQLEERKEATQTA